MVDTHQKPLSCSVCTFTWQLLNTDTHTDCNRKRLLSSALNLYFVLFVVVLFYTDKTVISAKHLELVTLCRRKCHWQCSMAEFRWHHFLALSHQWKLSVCVWESVGVCVCFESVCLHTERVDKQSYLTTGSFGFLEFTIQTRWLLSLKGLNT